MEWKKSIQPIQRPKILIQKQSAWRSTISPLPEKPKEFNLDDHKGNIHELIVKHVQSIKHEFKGEPGKNGVGKDGNHGNQWLLSDEVPEQEFGKKGDICLCADGDVYSKDSGEWVKKLTLKGSKGDVRYIGGGVTEDRVNQLISANGGGGGTAQVIVSTTSSMTVTTETDVIVKGSSAVTISLKAIAAPITTKVINKSTENCTVNIDGGGTISDTTDDTSFIIVPGNSFTFLPETGVAYHVS